MPVFSYFLIVGSVLSGLLFYADSVMVAASLPFRVSQNVGLPEPYKAPTVEFTKPEIIVAAAKPPVEMKKPVKAVRVYKPTRVVRQSVPKEHYAAYPPHQHGSVW